MELVRNIILALALLIISHEFIPGHWFTAAVLKLHPKVRKAWHEWTVFGVTIKVPGIVIMHDPATERQNRIIGVMGFGGSLLVGLALICFLDTIGAWVDKSFLVAYFGVLTAHFLIYPFKMASSAANDFNRLDADDDPRR